MVSVLIIKIKSRSAILLHAGPAPQYTCVHEHDQVTGIGSNSDDVSDVVFFFSPYTDLLGKRFLLWTDWTIRLSLLLFIAESLMGGIF